MTSNAEYHADPAISASHLHAVAVSPYHYWKRFIDPARQPLEPTAAMRLGTLVHCAVLEFDELLHRYGVCGPRNTKAGKEQAAAMAAEGIEAVSETDMLTALSIAVAVHEHPAASLLLHSGKAEQSFWWDDKTTGLRCKCRPDWMTGTTLVDLKTTADASPRGFARSVAAYRYHVQANHYLDGVGAERFIFIAVEKTYPFAVGVYELDAAAMAHGEDLRRRNLATIADCRAINEWPGYSTGIEPISLPTWALRFDTTTITSEDF
jgi:hypothetical protein